MGKRKWNKLDWYRFHQAKAEQKSIEQHAGTEKAALAAIDKQIENIRSQQAHLRRSQSLASALAGLIFGGPTSKELKLLEQQLDDLQQKRISAYRTYAAKAEPAAELGRAIYENERKDRHDSKIEAAIQRRLRYLERSKSIRSAQVPLKEYLLLEQANEGLIECYYCRQSLPGSEIHLDHKTPVARGGTNAMSNLVLACAKCNLKKGRKTEAEFRRYIEDQ